MADNKNKVIIDLDVNTEKAKSGFSKIGDIGSKAFKGIGTAIKGAGIGLLIGVFAALFEALKKNQKVMDTINTVINAMGVLIKPVVDGVSSLIEKFSTNNELMDKMGGIIKNLLKLSITPLKLAFDGVVLVINELQLGWLKVQEFFGKKIDTNAVKELQDNIKTTKDNLKETAKDAKDAVVSIAKDAPAVFKESAKIIKATVNEVVDDYKDLSVKSALAQGKAIDQASKALERLNIQHEALKLKYNKEEELQRQIRDNTNLSFEERKAASEKLLALLDEQEQQEKKIIGQKIANQNILLSQDKNNEEAKNALLELNNELLDVEDRIAGLRSEQLTSQINLNDEEIQSAKDKAAALQEINKELAAANKQSEIQQAIDSENERHISFVGKIKDLKLNAEEEQALLAKAEKLNQDNLNKIKTDATKETEEQIKDIKLEMQNLTDEERAKLEKENQNRDRIEKIKELEISEAEKNELILASQEKLNQDLAALELEQSKIKKEKRAKDIEETINTTKEQIQQFSDSILEIAGAAAQMEEERQLTSQNLKFQKQQEEINNLNVTEEEKAQLLKQAEDKNQKEIKKIQLKAAKEKDRIAKAQVLIDAATAVMGTWSGYASMGVIGAVLAGIQTAAIAATAAAQIGSINKAASERGNFANGGIVPGTSYTGDNVTANVNSDEMILNKEQQARLFQQANGLASGGGLNPQIIADAVIAAIKSIPVVITEQAITEKQKEVQIRESKFSY